MTVCKCCNRAFPEQEPLARDQVRGNGHAWRAAEIALLGSHPILLIGGFEAEGVGAWVERLGGTAYVVERCLDNNFRTPIRECKCSMAEIRRFWRSKKKLLARCDLLIETVEARVHERAYWPEAEALRYLDACRSVPEVPAGYDELSRRLLEQFRAKLQLPEREPAVERVARTIARADSGQPGHVTVTHLAEALQYNHGWWLEEV